MANNQGQPESEPVVTTADETLPVGGAPVSDDQPTTNPAPPPAEVPKVAGVDDYEKRLKAATEPVPEVEEPTQEQSAEGNDTENGGRGDAESVPPATPATEEPAPEPETPTTEEPEDKIPDRIRLGGLSDKSRAKVAAATLLAKSEGIEFEEAFARINGTPKPPEGKDSETEGRGDAETTRSLADVDKEIAEAKETRRKAVRDLDPDGQFAAEDRLEALQAEKQAIAAAERQHATVAQTTFEQNVDKSQALAEGCYPVMADANHAIHAEASRIWDTMEKTKNPLITQEDAPFRIYQMAANQLGIAPVDPESSPKAPGPKPPAPSQSSPSATPKPQAVAQTAVVRPNKAPSPASAADRTTPPGPTPRPLGKIRTAADYENTVAALV